jgi:hypothetical protein
MRIQWDPDPDQTLPSQKVQFNIKNIDIPHVGNST